jgi:hypothetical protein
MHECNYKTEDSITEKKTIQCGSLDGDRKFIVIEILGSVMIPKMHWFSN